MKSAMWRSPAIDAATAFSSFGAAFLMLGRFAFFKAQIYRASRATTWWHGQFNLAVCPSAACSPAYGAKVPYAIALWLAVLRRPVHCGAVASHSTWHPAVMAFGHHCLAFASSAANLAGSRPQVLVNRPACRRSASIRRLARCSAIRQNCCQSKGVLACQGQTSASKARLACSHRRLLLAPA